MPSPRPSQHLLVEPIFIGLAGRIGAGKTSAAQYVSSKYGFQYTRYSAILQDWFPAHGSNKDRLQKLGWDIMAGGRQVELNSRLLAGVDHSRSGVIDGLRHRVDFDSLSSTFGSSFRLVFLQARQETRFHRLGSRFSDYISFQEADSHPVEAHIDSLKAFASMIILNDESLEGLYRQLDALITSETGEHK
jgi:dephospho-CoA kinase